MIPWPTGSKCCHRGCWRDTVEVCFWAPECSLSWLLQLGHISRARLLRCTGPFELQAPEEQPPPPVPCSCSSELLRVHYPVAPSGQQLHSTLPGWFCTRMTPWVNGFPQQLGRWISGKVHWHRTTVTPLLSRQFLHLSPGSLPGVAILLLHALTLFISVLCTSY